MRILFIVLVLVSLLFSDADREEYHKYSKHITLPYDMRYLNLSKLQEKKIHSLLLLSKKRFKKLHKKIEKIEHSLVELFNQEVFDKQAFINQQLKLKKEALKIEADLLDGIHHILTKEQRKKFVRNLKEWEID